ncbi:hypothetical protein DL89DRAFT_42144 [Linderina pennispora]|uniref:Uncharacterized protein n=1 Tax=Linderina pennispora TaxID=61395 RepID=A0A1Y1VT98_9FUNG|nr:uncharacterized protein DL89DRAFT_42144 [Linderina pennispora]ORX64235.1 hypothetical protein DL89DRAFT_42144 [Linderina pennispora]
MNVVLLHLCLAARWSPYVCLFLLASSRCKAWYGRPSTHKYWYEFSHTIGRRLTGAFLSIIACNQLITVRMCWFLPYVYVGQ